MNLALGGYIFEKDKKTRVINKHDTIFQHYVFYLIKKILCNKKYVGK